MSTARIRAFDSNVSTAEAKSPARTAMLWIPAVVLLVGLLITAVLAAVSREQYLHNESRLLRLRVRDAAALLAESVPAVQTPLASAAAFAAGTNGNVSKFDRFVAPDVGRAPQQFISLSLWRAGMPRGRAITTLGARPQLGGGAIAAPERFSGSGRLGVVGFLAGPRPALGFAYASEADHRRYIVYGERLLPVDRRSRYESSSQFSDLDYAIYFGRRQRAQNLLVGDAPRLPFTGTHAAEAIPFGTGMLTLVMAPRGSLEGALPHDLPLIIAIGGVVLSLAGAYVALRLLMRRWDAERLAARLAQVAGENRRLYAEQRGIAETLQHALLPGRLPNVRGTETVGRYEAGDPGVDIGGDFYDVIELDRDRLLMVVGDVSGHGLAAATTMAQLRFAIRAYAAEHDPPEAILGKLTNLVNLDATGQLATIVCTTIDANRRELTVTSAGHLPPLLITDDHARLIDCDVGLPIGVTPSEPYRSTAIQAGAAGTLVAYTDGLVEQRGESLDVGLGRLRNAAGGREETLAELLAKLLKQRPGRQVDDIAILGVRWAW